MNTGEFFKKWGEGIQSVTPYQQSKISLMSSFLVIIGVCIGLYATFNVVWWLFIILLGSLGLTTMQILGNIQKFLVLRKMNQQINQAQEVANEQERRD